MKNFTTRISNLNIILYASLSAKESIYLISNLFYWISVYYVSTYTIKEYFYYFKYHNHKHWFLRKTDMLPNIKVCCLHIPQNLKIAYTTNFTFRNILPLVFIFSLFGRNFHIYLTIYNYEENQEKCLSWWYSWNFYLIFFDIKNIFNNFVNVFYQTTKHNLESKTTRFWNSIPRCNCKFMSLNYLP